MPTHTKAPIFLSEITEKVSVANKSYWDTILPYKSSWANTRKDIIFYFKLRPVVRIYS